MKELWGRYSAEQKRILRLTGILVCVLLILGILYGRLHGGQPVLQLQRPDPGEPEEDVALDITLADDAGEKGTMHWEGKLAERQLPAEEAEELIARAFEQIEEEMFYEQEDDGHVVTGLKIPKSVGVVQIHCTADPEVFDADWKVIPGRIREETIVALDLYATAGQVSKVLQRIVVVRSAELPPMERALMNLTDRLQDGYETDYLATYVTRRIMETHGMIKLSDLADETGYTDRYLRKVMGQKLGMRMKTFSQIVQMQWSYHLGCEELSEQNLALLAQMCGYYDQSHMNASYKKLTGMLPRDAFTLYV